MLHSGYLLLKAFRENVKRRVNKFGTNNDASRLEEDEDGDVKEDEDENALLSS